MLSVATSPLLTETCSAPPFILLVDDHQPSLDKLRQLVEAAGHVCVTTPSAPEALIFCDSRRPTLVVTDLAMPRLDGAGLARWLKARYPALPILLLTGELLDSPTRSNLRETFSAVLSKPLEIEPFLSLLQQLMTASGA